MSKSVLRIVTAIIVFALAALSVGLALPSAASAAPRPVVIGVKPSGGPAAGKNIVTITGRGFVNVTKVRFGTKAATDVKVKSSSTITAKAPAGSGTVYVRVTTRAGGVSAALSHSKYRYYAAPVITGISPTGGSTGGGTAVTITGKNFDGVKDVSFGTEFSSITTKSSTSITVLSPAHDAGPVHVRVTTPGGTSAIVFADVFTYVEAVTITGVTPASGPASGGELVTISGTNFIGVSAVKFGATASPLFMVTSASSLTALAPAGTGTVDVTVTTPAGVSEASAADKYTYVVAPTVTNVDPAGGPAAGGTEVTVKGTGFTTTSTVKFGATAATNVTFVSPTELKARAPAGAAGSTVDVTVTTAGVTSATSYADGYTYSAAPTVTEVRPGTGSAAGGTLVTITGTNLGGASKVEFGTATADVFTVSSTGTSITAVAPAGTGTVDVTVTTPGGTSAASAASKYTYTAELAIATVSPAIGPTTGGTAVTITGANFTNGATVSFGATPATSVVFVSATEITCVTPAHAAGPVNVTVITPGDTVMKAGAFTYQQAE